MNGNWPADVRALTSLTTGATTAAHVSAQVGESEAAVTVMLERGVREQLVQRLDLADGPAAYSLTPKGLEAVGIVQATQGAVDDSGQVNLGAATRLLMEQYEVAKDVAAQDAVREQASWPVDDATRDRVCAALNDAFARGALTQEELGSRTTRALDAQTMGELRAAGEGVIQLPPVLPKGVSVRWGDDSSGGPEVRLNPLLKEVQWSRVAVAAVLVLVGLVAMVVQPLVGLGLLAAGLILSGIALRPLAKSASIRIRTR